MATIDGTPDFQNVYSYNALSNVSYIEQSGLGGNAVALKQVGFDYTATGQLASIARYTGYGTGLVANSTYSYDGFDRLAGLVHANAAGTTLAGYSWSYDDGNRVDLDRTMTALAENGLEYSAGSRAASKKLAILRYVASDGAV